MFVPEYSANGRGDRDFPWLGKGIKCGHFVGGCVFSAVGGEGHTPGSAESLLINRAFCFVDFLPI